MRSRLFSHLPRAFAGARIMIIAAAAVAGATLAGCASNSHMADASWSAVGNNGGKVDRFAVARAASGDASIQVASAPAAANRPQ